MQVKGQPDRLKKLTNVTSPRRMAGRHPKHERAMLHRSIARSDLSERLVDGD
jgi:hypothetical protein